MKKKYKGGLLNIYLMNKGDLTFNEEGTVTKMGSMSDILEITGVTSFILGNWNGEGDMKRRLKRAKQRERRAYLKLIKDTLKD